MKKPIFKLCELCRKVKIPRGRPRYCGSYKRKNGCSYIMYRINQNRYVTEFKKRHPEYEKEHEKRRVARGYYKTRGRIRRANGYEKRRYELRKGRRILGVSNT